MINHIWGNIYLYCWENKIDFRKIFNKLRDAELEAYKEGCEQFWIPYTYNKNSQFNRRKLVGSTLELDVNVLTSYFHISIEEIFKPQNYLKRLIELMKTVAYDCRSDAEYEFFHYKDKSLQFRIKYETIYNENYEIGANIPVEYRFSKYYNEATHSFHYRIILDPNFLLSFSCTSGDISMAFYNLNDYVNFELICLYDGDADIIANYFKETSKYDVFTEYKYKEKVADNGITWISRTDEILSEISSDDYRIIDFKCIVVKSAIRKCDNEEHHTKIINGIFFTISRKTGNVKYTIIPLVYCQECNVYFMYDFEYNSLCMQGRPLCKIYRKRHFRALYMSPCLFNDPKPADLIFIYFIKT